MLKKANPEATNFIELLATHTPDVRFDPVAHVVHAVVPVQAVQLAPHAVAADGALM